MRYSIKVTIHHPKLSSGFFKPGTLKQLGERSYICFDFRKLTGHCDIYYTKDMEIFLS